MPPQRDEPPIWPPAFDLQAAPAPRRRTPPRGPAWHSPKGLARTAARGPRRRDVGVTPGVPRPEAACTTSTDDETLDDDYRVTDVLPNLHDLARLPRDPLTRSSPLSCSSSHSTSARLPPPRLRPSHLPPGLPCQFHRQVEEGGPARSGGPPSSKAQARRGISAGGGAADVDV